MPSSSSARPIRTLKQLRAVAPRQDRNLPVFAPFKRATDRPDNFTWATTLDELRIASGPHAEAVIAYTRWTAILVWLECAWDRATLTHDCDLSYQVAELLRDDDRLRLELPNRRRKPWSSLLPRFSPETQAELRLVGAELIYDWERAGRPYLTPELLKRQHRYVLPFTKMERNRR